MELALLFALLPVAAFSGWWVARRQFASSDARENCANSEFSSDYFKGLNLLLNEQPDKAIDVFVNMLQVDNDTVETHLALGNLFRRQGEGERAIRIHQNLIARPTLSKKQRALALFELGQDYLRAGLLGRSESLFTELLEQGEYRAEALEKLLAIYTQERDWEKAIDVARRFEQVSGRHLNLSIAQFYCELADGFLAKAEYRPALKMCKRALAADKQCVRATLLKSKIERHGGDCKQAIKTLKHVEKQEVQYLPEIVEPLLECYHSLGKFEEAEQYLGYLSSEYGGITPLLGLAEILRHQGNEKEATDRIAASLRERPSVRGLDQLIELHLVNSQGVARDNLLILKELTRRLLEEKLPYRCGSCGFKAKTLRWHCPSCKEWASIRPIQGVIGE
ncbi:MAG: lipopolysaccharide assembly protein LapB [Ectothiorhodospiraceae bacterium]|nr:lipopolysaccharide assembly protein LapB [Ectothiorhodospiraceae bacterium]